ncbi:MAG: flagellar motor protein MotB [Pseudolabrys sp.]|nr:flagellar motor protein MotB [Pseudolabrys sp.]
MAKKRGGHAGGHGWFVTFADLMGLLMSFFVMLVAFSTQDQAKLQVVAGSMRDAFGVQDKVRYTGVLEVMGLPTRPKLKNVANIDPKDASPTPAPDEKGLNRNYGARLKEDRKFALAAASLRQALQSMPEITEASKHVMLEETKQGLNIEITDQDGRSMFAEGSKEPFERTRLLVQRIAPALKAMPFRIAITGHTATTLIPARPGYGPWELSADRANTVRQILAAEGVPAGHFFMVAGKADTEPLFPDNPSLAPNRRVTITLIREEPPIPADLTP